MSARRAAAVLAAVAAAGAGGFWAGGGRPPVLSLDLLSAVLPAEAAMAPAPDGPVIYWRDPDGAPVYSATPRSTADGRAFVAVRASEDAQVGPAPAPAPVVAAGGPEPTILYYRNPMGLPDTSPTPKKDSMGMDYIPVYDGEIDDGPVVTLSPGKLQRTGVRSVAVERQVVSRPLRAPGLVEVDERRVTVVATRSDAFIESVADVTTGDSVTAGQPLAQVYSQEITAAAALFLSALSGNAGAGAEAGARQRLVNLGMPAEALASLEAERKVPLSLTWSAPRDGVVLERNAAPGMMMEAGMTMFRLADISVVWVVAEVPEYDIGAVRLGAPVRVTVRSHPGRVFEGVVGLIHPAVSPETRTVKVRVELANPDGALMADMYADVDIASGDARPVPAVPDGAIIDDGSRQVVIVDLGEGRFEPRPVTLGARGDGVTEIRSGVGVGERVVTAANFLIDAESNLKAALSALTAGEEAR
jgi:Cu(I)/Ag(I) efflux system membrane fusion protein